MQKKFQLEIQLKLITNEEYSFIGSGRVQIDYNHRYAGKTILFDVNVIKSLDSPNDKVDGILKNRLPVEDSKISFDLKDKEVTLHS